MTKITQITAILGLFLTQAAWATGTASDFPPPAPSTPAPVLTSVSCAGEGPGALNLNCAGDGTYVLSSFKFRFKYSGHKLARISVGAPQSGSQIVEFADINGDDPYNVTTEGVYINDPRVRTGRTRISAGWNINLASGPAYGRPDPSYMFALSGFQCEYDNRDEHHFGSIDIFYNPDSNVIWARLRDGNQDDPATCLISYAWLPSDLGQRGETGPIIIAPAWSLSKQSSVSQSGRFGFLSGFRIDFGKNDDHFVEFIGGGMSRFGVGDIILREGSGAKGISGDIRGGILY